MYCLHLAHHNPWSNIVQEPPINSVCSNYLKALRFAMKYLLVKCFYYERKIFSSISNINFNPLERLTWVDRISLTTSYEIKTIYK